MTLIGQTNLHNDFRLFNVLIGYIKGLLRHCPPHHCSSPVPKFLSYSNNPQPSLVTELIKWSLKYWLLNQRWSQELSGLVTWTYLKNVICENLSSHNKQLSKGFQFFWPLCYSIAVYQTDLITWFSRYGRFLTHE